MKAAASMPGTVDFAEYNSVPRDSPAAELLSRLTYKRGSGAVELSQTWSTERGRIV